MDNNEIVLKDTRVHAVTADHVGRILDGPYWEVKLAGLYRPLVNLSYLFNYAVLGNGANSFGYHLINFSLHAINIGLVYALGLLIFDGIPPAFLLAALWGVHPVLTESVTNIVGRADLLAALGVLGSLLSYTKAMRSSGRIRAAWFLAAALAASIGIFSKESAIVAIGVLVLYDLSLGGNVPWRSRLPGYAAVAGPALVFLAVRSLVLARVAYGPIPFTDNPLVGASFWTSGLTAVKVVGYDLVLLLWPSSLSCDYSYNQIPLFTWNLASWEDDKALLALLACIAAAVFALRAWGRDRRVFFGIGFFFVTISPTANLAIRIGAIMAERFLYLPAAGFLLCICCGFDWLWRRAPRYRAAVSAAAALALIAAAVRTYDRNRDWDDERRLWRSSLAAAPGSYKLRIMVAANTPLATPAGWQAAADEAARALAILNPLPKLENAGPAYQSAGTLYRAIGNQVAAAKGGPTIGAKRDDPGFWYRKSLAALLRSEKIELARDDLYRRENAARGRPGLVFLPADLYLELGRTYLSLSDSARALAAFERGRHLESDPDLLEELAALYRQAGNQRAAAQALIEALAVDPSRVQIGPSLVELYSAIDPSGCAVVHSGAGPELNINCPLVHADICRASRNVAANYVQKGQTTEAAAIRRTAAVDLDCAADLLN
ncbi:MAG: protein O-mannosyl-transferase TMTC1-related protein [Bryobacteraceae bacterium]